MFQPRLFRNLNMSFTGWYGPGHAAVYDRNMAHSLITLKIYGMNHIWNFSIIMSMACQSWSCSVWNTSTMTFFPLTRLARPSVTGSE